MCAYCSHSEVSFGWGGDCPGQAQTVCSEENWGPGGGRSMVTVACIGPALDLARHQQTSRVLQTELVLSCPKRSGVGTSIGIRLLTAARVRCRASFHPGLLRSTCRVRLDPGLAYLREGLGLRCCQPSGWTDSWARQSEHGGRAINSIWTHMCTAPCRHVLQSDVPQPALQDDGTPASVWGPGIYACDGAVHGTHSATPRERDRAQAPSSMSALGSQEIFTQASSF